MKKLVLFLLLTSGVLTTVAQTKTTTAETQTTTSLTIYQEFQPATIHLVDGKQLRVGLANIFLKNSVSTRYWLIRLTPQGINSSIVPSALILLPGKVCLPTTAL